MVVAAAVMIVGMAACSDTGPTPNDASGGHDPGRKGARSAWANQVGPSTLRQVVRVTTGITSGRVELSTTLTGLTEADGTHQGIDAVGMVHRASFDLPAGRAAVETDMSDMAIVSESGAGRGDQDDFTQPVRMVVEGDSVYTQIGPLAGSLGLEPTAWIRRDLDSVVSQGVDSETAALLFAPLGTLEVLLTPARAIRVVGDGEVSGVPVVHLKATLDLNDARRDGSAPAGPDTFPGRLRASGVEELPVEVWLDDDQVLRRLVVRLEPGMAGRSGTEGLTTVFELHDVNAAVEITAPPRNDVVDAATLRRDR